MKKILLFISILLATEAHTQELEFSVCLTSPSVDTLFLPDNKFGELIASSWENCKKKPVIVFKEKEILLALSKNPLYLNNTEEKRKIMNQYN